MRGGFGLARGDLIGNEDFMDGEFGFIIVTIIRLTLLHEEFL
jgi:hypothetical protein